MSLNTTPRTWVASEVVTATHMNTEVRDALTGIQAAWTSFTPSWTGTGGNPAIGNGTLVGRYLQVGKLIVFRIAITMGSTTTFGSGEYRLTLPVSPNSNLGRMQFTTSYLDAGTADRTGVATWDSSITALRLQVLPTTAGAALSAVSPTVPHTWANTDQIVVGTGVYEAA